jgi:hypothetical protein
MLMNDSKSWKFNVIFCIYMQNNIKFSGTAKFINIEKQRNL